MRILRRRLQAGMVHRMKIVCGHVGSLLFPLVWYNSGSKLKKPRVAPESSELANLIDVILSFIDWYYS
jgi:hypothetical protein